MLRRDRELNRPPGPRGSWLLGSARDLRRDQLGTYEAAMRAYGDFACFRVGPPRVGFVFDVVFSPEGARQVLSTGLSRYVKEAPLYTEFRRVLGEALLTSEGAVWRQKRRTLQPLFSRHQTDLALPDIVQAAEGLAASWNGPAREGREVDLHEGTTRYALEVLGTALFGGDMQDMAPILREAVPVLTRHAARRALAPVRLPHSWPTPANRAARQARLTLYQLVEGLIDRRQTEASADELVGRLLAVRDPETGAELDRRAVRNELVLFLVAGHETTAASLAFTLNLLGRHQEIQERVRVEAESADGLRDLPYTSQVVDESLRLYPPAHTIVRCAHDGGQILGHHVPPGRIVAVSVWGIHHNPDVWPDPQRFDPDRFARVANNDEKYTHLPFGGGPRACIGVHLALAELVMAVATVARRYRLRCPPSPLLLDAGVTLRPRGPLWCSLEPISGR